MSKQQYSKAKGRDAEKQVVQYLRANGYPNAERRRLMGAKDCGDVAGITGLVIEVKSEKKINLAGYMDELEVEVTNEEARDPRLAMLGVRGLVVIKRRGVTDPAKWYAVMPLHQAVHLLRDDICLMGMD